MQSKVSLKNEYGFTVSSKTIKEGFIKEVGSQEYAVLTAILAFTDEHRRSYITQRQIAAVLGVSLPTVNRATNKLLKKEWKGSPILKRKKHQGKY